VEPGQIAGAIGSNLKKAAQETRQHRAVFVCHSLDEEQWLAVQRSCYFGEKMPKISL
jgi:hypothetical protein